MSFELMMAGAQIGSDLYGIKSQKKMTAQQEKQRKVTENLIRDFGLAGIEAITPSYQQAQDIRQQALDQTLGLQGETFAPQMEAMRRGDYMAQQAALAGLMGQRNALLGDPINYGALQPQSVPVNYSELSGLTDPQSLQFQQMQVPQYTKGAELGLTPINPDAYLAANPDVLADYEANKDTLAIGGDPTLATKQGFALRHFDQYGRAENRPMNIQQAAARQTTTTGQATAAAGFSPAQVQNIFNAMGGEQA